ncbi:MULTISPECIES: type II toxin-antitoxin system HipA family toxin [unclassified Cryobacterium]|uniref:type II toxin-antitoxin system HipA family toxin n=2 Tax=unclassified Cryobacterium TaxID=2649013 RepID=UPI002AB49F8A|nr:MULTISPECIES: HipA domain-containing protein [unclassified Cryobacterium]MDY7529944.1 HipA domain-containing protein [Cryobacterium sp. 10C2]MDY7557921.1 HipA domain-containing protein [Cryobacterium sp. 10C3]MEB0288509.1 HipA domain-containing protein [Cryobacterium sp. 10S3]WPX13741.1 HipA domain-containing protein [Cryobacterium sp. 10S3]
MRHLATTLRATLMADLRVEIYGELVGCLVGADRRAFDFNADKNAIDVFGLGSTILSESVPFDLVVNRSRAARRRNFFAELLPEGTALDNLAAEIRASTDDIISLLAQFGRDVAGAVQIYDPEAAGEPRTPDVALVDGVEVGKMLTNAQAAPLGNRPKSGRTSLAGVQDKIVLALKGDQWFQVLEGYPSTHIVKPPSARYPSITFDEEYGFRAAKAAGLTTFDAWIEDFGGVLGLVIERYDRSPDAPQGRIHQEDMNQALGASKNEKYQEFGGKVTLKRVAHVLGRNGDRRSVDQLLGLLTVSQALGNLDMHGKNISMLHMRDGSTEITPAYDVVPQTHLDSDGKMALAVNRKYLHAAITIDDLIAEGLSWNIRSPRAVIISALEAVESFAHSESPVDNAYVGLQDDVRRFTRNLLEGRPTGETR